MSKPIIVVTLSANWPTPDITPGGGTEGVSSLGGGGIKWPTPDSPSV